MIRLKVNGAARQFDGEPDMPLLWYLRDSLELTGTKYGCGIGQCGSCTVHLDGKAVRSCQTQMKEAAGKTIVTIEGLSVNGDHPVQCAWKEINVPQCGYCQSGQMMQAAALLKEHPKPTDQEHRRRHERQHLPLRDLPAHSRGDKNRRHRDEGRAFQEGPVVAEAHARGVKA